MLMTIKINLKLCTQESRMTSVAGFIHDDTIHSARPHALNIYMLLRFSSGLSSLYVYCYLVELTKLKFSLKLAPV